MAYGGQNPYGHGYQPEFTSQFHSFEFHNGPQQQQSRPPWVQEWDQNYGSGVWTPSSSANQQQQPLMSYPYPQQQQPPQSRVQRSKNQQPRRQPNSTPRQQSTNNSSGGGQRQPRGTAGQQPRQPRQQQNEPRRQQHDRRQYQQQQPEYQQQRVEERTERRPLNDIVNERNDNFPVETEHANSPEPSLSSAGAKKKRSRPPKKPPVKEQTRPGSRWSRDGDRRPRSEFVNSSTNYEPTHYQNSNADQSMHKSENIVPKAYLCPVKRDVPVLKFNEPQFKTQRELLIHNMNYEKSECMVCYEVIRHKNPIWSCSHCYNIFHIWCIQKWSEAAEDNLWRCPGCQRQYVEPPEKSCFCGKTRQQAKDMHLKSFSSKHCCEEICYKKRPKIGANDCEHLCNEMCHPGACPPCEGMSLRKCCCGKKSVRVKCSNDSELLCDDSCDKLLSCGRHKCPTQCHPGPCDECTSMTDLVCKCGRKKETVPCVEAPKGDLKNFSCETVCGNALECGHHVCQEVCHAFKCQPCPLLPEVNTYCLCGKVAQAALLLTPRKSCLDPVPQCPNKCNKPMPCDHNCPEKCHDGACPPCTQQSQAHCACKSSKKMVPCAVLAFEPYRCNKKCTKWLSCLRHKCHDVCCCRETHDCLQLCNKLLNCGQHRCDLLCHSDRCQPCLLAGFDEQRCECGASVAYPPIPCGAKPPACNKPCTRQHPCGHNGHNCHSEEECPPCTVPVKKWCMGKHKEVFPVLCNQEYVSCHLLCSAPLECGQHSCVKKCHAGPCTTERCTQSCSKPRPDCGHSCNAACHGPAPCPDAKCTFELKVTCECKTRSETRPCHQQLEAYKRKVQMEAMVESMSELMQGNKVALPNTAPLAHWTSVVGLECGPECSVKQRLDRAFVALQIVNPDLGQKLKLDYPVALQNWVAQDKEFVKEVHNILADLVFRAQEGTQRFRIHSFGVMNQMKRKFIHEYAPYFGLTSQSMDKRHSRSVDVTAEKNNCWLPSISLHEMVGKKLTHSSSRLISSDAKKMTLKREESVPAPTPSSSSTVLSYTQALAAKKNQKN